MKNVRSEVRLRRSEKRLSEVRLRRSEKRLSEEGYGEVKTFAHRMLRRRDECLERNVGEKENVPVRSKEREERKRAGVLGNMKKLVDEKQQREEENSRSFAFPSAGLSTIIRFYVFAYYKLFCFVWLKATFSAYKLKAKAILAQAYKRE